MFENQRKRQSERELKREELVKPPAGNLFFEHCADRMTKIPDDVRGILEIQIQQLSYNAQNRLAPPLQIMPLPPAQIQIQPPVPFQAHMQPQEFNSDVYSSAMSVINNN